MDFSKNMLIKEIILDHFVHINLKKKLYLHYLIIIVHKLIYNQDSFEYIYSKYHLICLPNVYQIFFVVQILNINNQINHHLLILNFLKNYI